MEKKKIVLILVGIILLFFGKLYAQEAEATIDGNVCPSAEDCEKIVCEGGTLSMTAGIDFGGYSSITWHEQYSSDGGNTYSTWNQIDTVANVTVPSSGAANDSLKYRYLAVVSTSSGNKYAFADVEVVLLPTANLSGTNVICAGQDVTFSASAGATNYDFRINGISAQSDTISQFSTELLNHNDTVVVIVTNSNGCSAMSSPIIMTVHDLPDVGSITPSITCNGEDMDFTYENLTGSGPWTVSFWNPTHTIQYGLDYDVSSSSGSLDDVPIPYGTSEVHFKIQDNNTGCSNF